MRLRIDTSGVKFRVAGTARAKQVKGQDARLPDGRQVWLVWLTAIEADRGTAERIRVEVAGDEPKLTVDDLVQVTGLTFAPWVNRDTKQIVRSFRAETITPEAQAVRRAA